MGDALPYSDVGHYRTWFYFNVKGVTAGETLTFSIRNMGGQGKLYKMGLRPVYWIKQAGSNKVPKWKRSVGYLRWDYVQSEGPMTVTWTHQFNDFKPNDTAYFAWTYPFSFNDSLIQT